MTLTQLLKNISHEINLYVTNTQEYRNTTVHKYKFDHEKKDMQDACGVDTDKVEDQVNIINKKIKKAKSWAFSKTVEEITKLYYMGEVNVVEAMFIFYAARESMKSMKQSTAKAESLAQLLKIISK